MEYTFSNLASKLNVLSMADIRDYHKIYEVGKIEAITEKAVRIELKSLGETIWLPLSLLRISTSNELWLISWRFRQLYGE